MARNLLAPALLSVALLLPASAPARAESGTERVLVFRVAGEILAEGRGYRIDIEPGLPADRAIRIYSEPSHTLMVAVLDRDFETSEAGRAWVERHLASDRTAAKVVTSLPAARPRVHVPAERPNRDSRIAVWVYGTWPDGSIEDRLVTDGLVGVEKFSLANFVHAEADWRPKDGGSQ